MGNCKTKKILGDIFLLQDIMSEAFLKQNITLTDIFKIRYNVNGHM